MARLNELAEFLRAHDDYCLFSHVNPDGDCLGSCIALALALRKLGKRAFVYVPGRVPTMYQPFETTVRLVSDQNVPYAPQTAFSVDVSAFERLDSGVKLFESCPHKCMLDHHGTNPGFGEVWYVDGKAAATAEPALELIDLLGVSLTKEMADWLYIALSTDSGQFSYEATRGQTMNAAARCIEAGADTKFICQELFRTRSEGHTRLIGAVISKFEMNAEKTMAWVKLTDADFKAAGATREDNEGVVNYMLEIRGVEFAALVEEQGSNTKVSLRSRGKINVAEIAKPLGGGGHSAAAGVTLRMTADAALETVLSKAKEMLRAACTEHA